jgi:hypothetical protein
MKERIDEHDMTKDMMAIMRGGYKSLLREADEPVPPADPNAAPPADPNSVPQAPENDIRALKPDPENPDELVIASSDANGKVEVNPNKDYTNVYNTELNGFKTLDSRVKITSFIIFVGDNPDVEIKVTFLPTANSGIDATLRFSENNLLLNSRNLVNTTDVQQLTNKLTGYYSTWVQKWGTELSQWSEQNIR